jgi:lipopolysaccharide biosynthesis glycosyltransferase
MNEINIAISASASYIVYAKVMMASIYAAHTDQIINLYVFYIDDRVILGEKALRNQARRHNVRNSVTFFKVDPLLLKGVDNGKGWALDLWARWYALDVLANLHERVLLLGIDTFVRSNISEFYFQEMAGYYFSGVPDMCISNTQPTAWPRIKDDMDRVGFKFHKHYINADVVLVNLKETAGKVSFSRFLDLYADYEFTCWDQDVVNYCFSKYVQYKNSHIYNYFPNLNLTNLPDSKSLGVVKIFHFAGGPKPWNVSPWQAKNFNGIPEWWVVARREGFPGSAEYVRYLRGFLRKQLNNLGFFWRKWVSG